MKIIGITGGTGSGKTTALNVLKDFDARIIDCDALYHELLNSCDEMKADIVSEFPEAAAGGKIDRRALGKVVFGSSEKLKKLNIITHGYVRNAVADIIGNEAKKGTEITAIDAIALFEGGLAEMCDVTVAVLADDEVRARRIMARDNITHEYAMLRIKAQKSEAFFRENADYILINDYSEAGIFKEDCIEFFHRILGGIDNERKK